LPGWCDSARTICGLLGKRAQTVFGIAHWSRWFGVFQPGTMECEYWLITAYRNLDPNLIVSSLFVVIEFEFFADAVGSNPDDGISSRVVTVVSAIDLAPNQVLIQLGCPATEMELRD